MPDWVNTAFQEYQKRLPHDYRLELIEVPTAKRAKQDNSQQCMQQEAEAIVKVLPSKVFVIALCVKGKSFSTEQLAQKLQSFHDESQDIAIVVGGPDGLANEILSRAQQHWSLSSLTLPHPLVRVLLAEQIYRSWSILAGHPYHR